LRSGSNSVVECLLPKQKVAGSNPVSRSKYKFVVCSPGRKPSRSLKTKVNNAAGYAVARAGLTAFSMGAAKYPLTLSLSNHR
jgi:hypothetical protein